MEKKRSMLVDVTGLVQDYVPMSRKSARRFIQLYLKRVKIGNRIYVHRAELEALLKDPAMADLPLDLRNRNDLQDEHIL